MGLAGLESAQWVSRPSQGNQCLGAVSVKTSPGSSRQLRNQGLRYPCLRKNRFGTLAGSYSRFYLLHQRHITLLSATRCTLHLSSLAEEGGIVVRFNPVSPAENWQTTSTLWGETFVALKGGALVR